MESKIRVLVADTEVEYSATLVRFLSGKHGAQFTVALVHNPEKLGRLLEAGYRADVLVATVHFLKSLEGKAMSDLVGGFEGILLLKETGSATATEQPKFRGYLGIVTETGKYQNADHIVKAIQTLHADTLKIERPLVKSRGAGKIGVFSPIGGTGKTFLAALIAKYLASIKKKVILLGFEDINSLKAYFPEMPEGRTSELYLGLKTRAGECSIEDYVWADPATGVDLLLPSATVSEPCELSAEEVEKVFSMNLDAYDFVISDLSAWDAVRAIKVLQLQDLVIFPIRDDLSSELKTQAWVEFCRGYEGERFEGLLGRSICVRLTTQLDPESYEPKDYGFSEMLSFRHLTSHDVERPEVREFVSKLL